MTRIFTGPDNEPNNKRPLSSAKDMDIGSKKTKKNPQKDKIKSSITVELFMGTLPVYGIVEHPEEKCKQLGSMRSD